MDKFVEAMIDLKQRFFKARILADIADGCPLTRSCDKLRITEDWRCELHLGHDGVCWMKYKEAVANDQKTEG